MHRVHCYAVTVRCFSVSVSVGLIRHTPMILVNTTRDPQRAAPAHASSLETTKPAMPADHWHPPNILCHSLTYTRLSRPLLPAAAIQIHHSGSKRPWTLAARFSQMHCTVQYFQVFDPGAVAANSVTEAHLSISIYLSSYCMPSGGPTHPQAPFLRTYCMNSGATS